MNSCKLIVKCVCYTHACALRLLRRGLEPSMGLDDHATRTTGARRRSSQHAWSRLVGSVARGCHPSTQPCRKPPGNPPTPPTTAHYESYVGWPPPLDAQQACTSTASSSADIGRGGVGSCSSLHITLPLDVASMPGHAASPDPDTPRPPPRPNRRASSGASTYATLTTSTTCSCAYINSICTHNIRPNRQTVSTDAVLCTTHAVRTFCCICSGATPNFAASADQSCSRMAFTAGTSGSSDASSSACRSKATSLRYICAAVTATHHRPSTRE